MRKIHLMRLNTLDHFLTKHVHLFIFFVKEYYGLVIGLALVFIIIALFLHTQIGYGAIIQIIIPIVILVGLLKKRKWGLPLIIGVNLIGALSLLFFNSLDIGESMSSMVGLTVALLLIVLCTRKAIQKYYDINLDALWNKLV